MSDILFNCPDCEAPLAVDGDTAGAAMSCPGCGKGIGVPNPGVEFKCAKCGHAHQAPEWAAGKPFTCLGCEAELVVPAPGFASQGAVGARRVHRLAAQPTRPEPAATREPQVEPPRAGHSLRANRDREGGGFPIDRRTVRIAVYALIGIVVIAVFGDPLKWEVWKHLRKGGEEAKTQVTNKVASAVAPPRPAPQTNTPPPKATVRTNQFWKAAHTNLSMLARNPKAPGGIARLESDVASLWDGDRDAAVALAAAYALLRLDAEQDAGGCRWIEANAPGTDAARRCARDNFYSPCQACKQTGETRDNCAQCSGGKCRACGGKGGEKRSTPPPRKLTPVEFGGGGNVRRMGGTQPRDEAPVETWVSCAACGGARKCAACDGKGFAVKPCYACRGSKRVYNPAAAARHRDEAVAAALRIASTRLSSESEPPPPPLETNAFLASFGASGAADLARLQGVLKGNEVSLWDAIMLYATGARDDLLSLDVDVADILMETTVPRSKTTLLDRESLGRLLESKGLLMRDARLPNGTNVLFVSSPAACAYLSACAQARGRQYGEAMRILAPARHERSGMGRQAAGLAKAMEVMARDWQALSALRDETKLAAADYTRAIKQATALRNAPVMESGASIKIGDSREINMRAAEGRVNAARDRIRRTGMSFDELLRKANESTAAIWDRLGDECIPGSLSAEGVVLVEYLTAADALVQDAARSIQETGITGGDSVLSSRSLELPAFIRSIDGVLRKAVEDSARMARDAEQAEGEDRMEKLGMAVAFDRCNAAAKVAFGHQMFLHRRKSMEDTLLSGDKADAVSRFGRRLGERQKRATCAVFNQVNEGGMPRPVEIPVAQGRVNGLAVSGDGKGHAFPVSVHLVDLQPRRLVMEEEIRTWYGNSVRRVETLRQPFPISFGDYGSKDPLVVISAIEAWKWLKYRHVGEARKPVGLHIEFTSLTDGKAGDSAGAAFGAAAWSAWSRTPLLQNVAMTGSIRSDGTVEGVGGVRTKVEGALEANGVETVVVPKANQSELASLSFEDLCTIAVVSADNMDTYVAYASGSGEATKAIASLRKGQMLAFLGRRREAWDALLPLVMKHPELYTARRLAEMLVTYDPGLAEGGAK